MMPLLLTVTAGAQGVSKLFGLVGGYAQANQSSNGYLFSTDSSGNNFQLKYDFPVTTFGANPQNVELANYNGKLYGTTYRGSVNNSGTIFKIMPNGSGYVKLFDFVGGTDGIIPTGPLITDGTFLYGTTVWGGANDLGTTFKIKSGKVFKKIALRTKRYECLEIATNKLYLFSPNAEVEIIVK